MRSDDQNETSRALAPGPRQRSYAVLIAALWLSWATSAGAAPAAAPPVPCSDIDHGYPQWNALLGRRVHDGTVDYEGLRAEDGDELNTFLRTLAGVCAERYATWTRPQQLAFWINAYNAYTIRLILDNPGITSIRSIGLLPGAAFRTQFIPIVATGSRSPMSLNDIEHGILRPRFREPRVHFAIVCASKGCPRLSSDAYLPDRLEEQLTGAARGFVRDPSKNHYDAPSSTLYLSSIFEWFREDFEGAASTLPEFVAPYLDPEVARQLNGATTVDFLEYDWSLNGK